MPLRNIKNPFVLFLPFFILYVILVFVKPTHGIEGDEGRYLNFAQNLIHGFYSPPAPNINLWNGPGYPILLVPFVVFHLPLICITLLNAILNYFSIILLFKTLQQYVPFKMAFIFSLFWACYYISYGELVVIYTEVFTSFLITLLIFYLVKSFNIGNKSIKNAIFSGLIIGYIVLTRVIFGYVLLVMLIGFALLFVLNKKVINYRRGLLILLVAMITITPYLIYTYHLTGKLYYLGDSGGMSLYWMTSSNENELGDWHHERDVHYIPTLNSKIEITADQKMIPGWNNSLYLNHFEDYKKIDQYVGVERDDTYKKIALSNIRRNPVKYLKNIVSNVERLFFNFPYSYTLQHSSIKIAFSGMVVIGMIFSLFISLINFRKIEFPLMFIIIFVIIYLGLTILVSAYPRMFTVIVPILLFWICYIIQKSIKIKFKFIG